MLQQTRVEVVRDYYERWMNKFPTVSALAESSESDVLHAWQGLGYYSRARRLREGAQFVQQHHGGELPESPDELLRVPGIGPYSAGAISSIAFGRPSAIVDGNVVRVLSRYFALRGDPNKKPLKSQLWSLAGQLVPARDPGTFNQALMEFGATLCTPKSPMCHACPLSKGCSALARGMVRELPELPKPKQKTQRTLVFAVLVHRTHAPPRGEIELGFLTLPPSARWWAGMDMFPFHESAIGENALDVARKIAREYGFSQQGEGVQLDEARHTVTRFDLSLVPVVFEIGRAGHNTANLRWVTRSRWAELSLPSAGRKILVRVEQFLKTHPPTR